MPPAQFGADAAIKVLDGPYTFFLADAVILTVPFWHLRDRRSRRLTWLGAVLLLFVVLLNRRTVWLTLVVGSGRHHGAEAEDQPRGSSRWSSAPSCSRPWRTSPSGGSEGGTSPSPGRRSAPARSTGASRDGPSWCHGLSNDPVQWAIGEPLGSGFTREVEGSEVQAEPHNFYVDLLLRGGVSV